jgi:BetR domain-containing protein
MEYQTKLFNQLSNKLPPGTSLVKAVANVLFLSDDSAYRRIRGETPLALNELQKISAAYHISIDELFAIETEGITFYYKSILEKEFNFQNYFGEIAAVLETITKAEAKEITYAAMDIPIFQHFQFPEFAIFKMFFWRKTIWEDPQLKNVDFSIKKIKSVFLPIIETIGKNITTHYANIPSNEIWHEETVTSTLRQIEFYLESGFFSDKGDCRFLCEQFCQLIEHMHDQTKNGFKFFHGLKPIGQPGTYKLYINELLFLTNTIMTDVNNHKTVYITHEALNYLATSNQVFCNETSNWLDIQMKKAQLISGTSEKIQNKFFSSQIKKIEKLMEMI